MCIFYIYAYKNALFFLCAYNRFNILNEFMRPFMHYLYLCAYICIFPKYEIRVSHLYLPFPHRSATVHFLCSTNCILTPLGSSTKMNFVNGLGCIGPALISIPFSFTRWFFLVNASLKLAQQQVPGPVKELESCEISQVICMLQSNSVSGQ